MKSVISIFLFIAISGFGFRDIEASAKVIETFNKMFKDVKDVKWCITQGEYEGVFMENEKKTIVRYNKSGHFLSSTRYYNEDGLPLNIVWNLKKIYKGKKIGIVTELIDEDYLVYSINLEDETKFFVVTSDANGNLTLLRRYNKQ